MELDPPGLPDALFRWATSFEFARSVTSWQDLQDGRALWSILAEIEPEYFMGSVPEPDALSSDNWIPKWQNLKHVDRAVMAFIRDECGKLPELSKRMNPDLKAIAIDASTEQIVQLLKAILLAAMYSPSSNQRMVKVMEILGPKVAIPIATCIGNMEQLDHQIVESEARMDSGSDAESMMSPDRSGTPAVPGLARDPELEREERLIQAYSTIKTLEERTAILGAELNQTMTRKTEAENELSEIKYRLEQGGSLGSDSEALKQVRQKSEQDQDYIAELETDVNTNRSLVETQKRQLERLKVDAGSKEKLRDELQLLRVERDDLLQKTKASENLKKKIQTLQESDKGNQTIRQELEGAQDEIQRLKIFKERCVALQKANEERLKLIANGEQEIFDQKTTRKRLDHEIKLYTQRFEAAKDRQARDAEIISEQEERIRDLEAGQGKETQDLGNLDDEVSSKDKIYTELKSKIADLEAENSRFKEYPPPKEEDSVAKQTYENLRIRFGSLERQYLNMYQENLGLDAALKDAEHEALESRPFVELRDRLRSEEEKRSIAEKHSFELENGLSELKTRLATAESKVSAYDKTKADALEELERSTAANTNILEQEKSRLFDRAKNYEFELEECRSLLRHSLLDRNAFLKEDSELRQRDEFRLVLDQLVKFKNESSPTEEELALSITQRIESGVEELKTAEANTNQVRTNLESQIESLQARLKQAEVEAAQGVKTPLQDNIQRELSLMTSAWYDVTSRMQSDAVIIHRRSEAPRSFLNRQRRLLGNPVVPKRR